MGTSFFNIRARGVLLCFIALFSVTSLFAETLSVGIGGATFDESYLASTNRTAWFVVAAVSSGLTRIVSMADGSTDFALSLADQVQSSADTADWTFRLRPGVTFSNGEPISGEDVVYSLNECVLNNKIVAPISSVSSQNLVQIGSRAYDVVEVKLKLPDPELPIQIATCPVVSKRVQTAFGLESGRGTNLIAAGPYYISEFRSGRRINFLRAANYAGRKPYFEGVILQNYTDLEQALVALRSGTLDLLIDANDSLLEKAKKDETLRITACQGGKYAIHRKELVDLKCDPIIMFDKVKYSS